MYFTAQQLLDTASVSRQRLLRLTTFVEQIVPDVFEVEYDELTEDDQRLVDAVWTVRDIADHIVDSTSVTLNLMHIDYGLNPESLLPGPVELDGDEEV